MTTGQLAKRLGVHQPRVIELERGEATGNITIKSLERAAEALGCRLVYTLVPEERLAHTTANGHRWLPTGSSRLSSRQCGWKRRR